MDHFQDEVRRELSASFPGHSVSMISLLEKDEDFKEITMDYIYCKKVLAELKHPTNNPMLIKEYKDTLEELEHELLTYMDNEQLNKTNQ
jgi:hypothetical protein